MSTYVPYLLTAAGRLSQGQATRQADDYNATVAAQYARAAGGEAGQEEVTQRRSAQMALGNAAAAAGEAGVSGGSTETVMRQSALNAELDALNIRYQGRLRSLGLNAKGTLDRYQGRQAQSQSNQLAGATLL